MRSPATGPASYRVSTVSGTLPADTERRVSVPLCVPAGGFADIAVSGSSDVQIAEVPLSPDVGGTRAVGVLLGPISVRRTGEEC